MAMTSESEQATEDNWMFPPEEGWTAEQVRDLELPFDWELVDGVVVPRGRTKFWHNMVRDRIAEALEKYRREPYEVVSEQCVLADEHNTPKPDVVVFGTNGLSFFELECIPPEAVALVVEVVSPRSRQDDRVRKPALFADLLIPFYWRVELGRDHEITVHDYWLHHSRREYVEAPQVPVHRRKLVVDHPFPAEIDLRALVRFGGPTGADAR